MVSITIPTMSDQNTFTKQRARDHLVEPAHLTLSSPSHPAHIEACENSDPARDSVMCGSHCSPRFEGASDTNHTTYLVLTASTVQLCLMTQDEIRERKFRSTEDTGASPCGQSGIQANGRQESQQTLTPATVERELQPSKRPPTGGWPTRVLDCPRAKRENAHLESDDRRQLESNDRSGQQSNKSGTDTCTSSVPWTWKDDAITTNEKNGDVFSVAVGFSRAKGWCAHHHLRGHWFHRLCPRVRRRNPQRVKQRRWMSNQSDRMSLACGTFNSVTNRTGFLTGSTSLYVVFKNHG